jgi:hypothetical protein
MNEPLKAVEMVRRIRDQMYEETKGLEADELLRYFKERSKTAVRRAQERDERQVDEGSRITR